MEKVFSWKDFKRVLRALVTTEKPEEFGIRNADESPFSGDD